MKLVILILAIALLLVLASAGLLWVVCWVLTLVGISLTWSWELFCVVFVVFVILTTSEFKG